MSFRDTILARPRPSSLRDFELPRRERFYPSPADWRDEVIYFLWPDRSNLPAARPATFRFDHWSYGGGSRWQGGNLKGIQSKLGYPVLRYGRIEQRQISNPPSGFALPPAGKLIAWSRFLDDEEAICVVNGNGAAPQDGDVAVAPELNGSPGATFTVVANSAQAATPGFTGWHPVGEVLPVKRRDGVAFVEIRNLRPSEVLVLVNQT